MATENSSFRRRLEESKARAEKDRESFCHEATTFRGMVTDLLNPVAEGWTEPEQLNRALAVLYQLAKKWYKRAPRGHTPLRYHCCVDEVYEEALMRLEAIKQLGLRQKIW